MGDPLIRDIMTAPDAGETRQFARIMDGVEAKREKEFGRLVEGSERSFSTRTPSRAEVRSP
jgi:hypothetical protein